MNKKIFLYILILVIMSSCNTQPPADIILVNGKIVTVDQNFSIAEAVAVKNDEILAVGTNEQVRKTAGKETRIIDLEGKTLIPGLIDAHLHPEMAAPSELDEEIPDVHTVAELLDWIRQQAKIKEKGQWIVHPKFFATRLTELRAPTLAELDAAAPDHPVFLNGSYGGNINSEAMRISGITKATNHPGILRDRKTGKLTGIIRASAFNLLPIPARKPLSKEEYLDVLANMLKRYNQIGFTSLCAAYGDTLTYSVYRKLREQDKLTARIFMNVYLNLKSGITKEEMNNILNSIPFVTNDGDEWVRIGALKVLLDGGILTGTAYIREPWGNKACEIFGITDTTYRGVVNYTREDLLTIVNAANERNWKFTAHSTGGGGVDLLLDVYGEVNKLKSIKERRFSIIHGNFFTPEAIKKMAELGVYADAQTAWFYKDADAMLYILGEKRIQTFHPNRSMINAGVMINGGSDHMVKWDPNTSINPYNPFLAMWSMVTRKTERGTVIVPQEAITREEALKIYTINNAYASFEEAIKGSIEPGKLADLVVLSDDILTCPEDHIRNITPELTMVGGRIVYFSGNGIKIPEGLFIDPKPAGRSQ